VKEEVTPLLSRARDREEKVVGGKEMRAGKREKVGGPSTAGPNIKDGFPKEED